MLIYSVFVSVKRIKAFGRISKNSTPITSKKEAGQSILFFPGYISGALIWNPLILQCLEQGPDTVQLHFRHRNFSLLSYPATNWCCGEVIRFQESEFHTSQRWEGSAAKACKLYTHMLTHNQTSHKPSHRSFLHLWCLSAISPKPITSSPTSQDMAWKGGYAQELE